MLEVFDNQIPISTMFGHREERLTTWSGDRGTHMRMDQKEKKKKKKEKQRNEKTVGIVVQAYKPIRYKIRMLIYHCSFRK